MVVTEEIGTLETMAVNPVKLIVSPKYLALLMMVPCLTMVADVAGILGGGVFVYHTIGMRLTLFIRAVLDSLQVRDVVSGLIKSVVSATVIAQMGCMEGFRVRGWTGERRACRHVGSGESHLSVACGRHAVCRNFLRGAAMKVMSRFLRRHYWRRS